MLEKKKKKSKGITSETEKETAIFFVCDTLSGYSIWLPSYGMHMDSVKKKSKGSNSERKEDQSFLYVTLQLS